MSSSHSFYKHPLLPKFQPHIWLSKTSQKHYRLALHGEKNAYVFRTGFKNQFIDFVKLLVTGHKGQQNAELWVLAKLGNLVGQCRSKKTHVSWRVVTIATSIQRRVSAESTPNVYHQRKALYPKEIWPTLTTSMPEVNKQCILLNWWLKHF